MLAFLQSELVPSIPLAEWTESAVDWITDNFEWFFDPLDSVIDLVVGSLEYILLASPALLMVAILGVIAFLLASWRVALFTVLGLVFVISLDLWAAAMQTLALVLAATFVALVIGIPIGIIAAKSETVETIIRPILDVAQTMPAFVYLVPIVVLLGIGAGPALIATVIFAMPPAVRLTMVGIAGLAGAGGLGEPVVTGLSQLNVGISFVGGVGIVVIAIMLDRVTRAMARGDRKSPWKIFSRGKRSEADVA